MDAHRGVSVGLELKHLRCLTGRHGRRQLPLDLKSWSHALVGHERRVVALASDDPWARRRSVRIDEIATRTLAIDRRTGTTTMNLRSGTTQPAVEYTQDIDDWLAAIATGRCVGVTPRATAVQYRRDGITYRPVRDADPVPVHLMWRRQDAHPATHAAVALAVELYRDDERTPASRAVGGAGKDAIVQGALQFREYVERSRARSSESSRRVTGSTR